MGIFEIIWKLLTLVGSIGLFLFGMKLMSESLQRAAGKRLRNALSLISANPFRGIISGFTLTSVIQFSSATVILTISLVNAGILSLYESVGIIMGANIGTTVKAWLISMLGFQYNFSLVLLPLVALALPLIFSGRTSMRLWGEFMIGFALIFLGFNFMKEYLPVLDPASPAIRYLSHFSGHGFGSVLVFVLTGLVITAIIQSSSATMALIFVMVSNHWINFEMAAAMVLGENVGTTLVPFLASLVANREARRAALVHLLFNLTGVIVALLLFMPLIRTAAWFSVLTTGLSPFIDSETIPLSLAFVHSAFNLGTTLLLVGFIPAVVTVAGRLLPDRTGAPETRRSSILDDSIVSTPELSLLQVRKQLYHFGTALLKMFDAIPVLLNTKAPEQFDQLFHQFQLQESLNRKIQAEITESLAHVTEGEMSVTGSRQLRALMKIQDDLENMAGLLGIMARTIRNKNLELAWFTPDLRQHLFSMFDLNRNALKIMLQCLRQESGIHNPQDALQAEEAINRQADAFRRDCDEKIHLGEIPFKTGSYFRELLALSEKLGDVTLSISQSLMMNGKPNG